MRRHEWARNFLPSWIMGALIGAGLVTCMVIATNEEPLDPTYYCYAATIGEPWDCYLEADQPSDPTNLRWEGPRDEIPGARLCRSEIMACTHAKYER